MQALAGLARSRTRCVYLVGGSVRDLLLGAPIDDVDLVVEDDAIALANLAADRLGGSAVGHPSFGTAKWTPAADIPSIDLALARAEHYPVPGSLPVVRPATLDADLARRDFSINAMAVDLTRAVEGPAAPLELIDPFGGRAALGRGSLEVLHDASFRDDPTRLWRAARFAGRLGLALSPSTRVLLEDAVADDISGGSGLGLERRGAEINRLLVEPFAAVRCAEEWGLWRTVHPGLVGVADRLGAIEAAPQLPTAEPSARAWVGLASLLPAPTRHALERLVTQGGADLERWRSSPERVQALCLPSADATPGAWGALLEGLDGAELALLATLRPESLPRVQWWVARGHALRAAITSADLAAAGVPPGPGMGRALRAALALARDGGSAADQLQQALAAALGAQAR